MIEFLVPALAICHMVTSYVLGPLLAMKMVVNVKMVESAQQTVFPIAHALMTHTSQALLVKSIMTVMSLVVQMEESAPSTASVFAAHPSMVSCVTW